MKKTTVKKVKRYYTSIKELQELGFKVSEKSAMYGEKTRTVKSKKSGTSWFNYNGILFVFNKLEPEQVHEVEPNYSITAIKELPKNLFEVKEPEVKEPEKIKKVKKVKKLLTPAEEELKEGVTEQLKKVKKELKEKNKK